MKWKITGSIIFVFVFPVLLFAQKNKAKKKNSNKYKVATAPAKVTKPDGGPDFNDYTLFHQDDFNGTEIDENIWSYRKENFSADSTIYLRKNAVVKDGYLNLITDWESDRKIFSGVSVSTDSNAQYQLTYGYFEIRAKLPQTLGNGGAFWMQSKGMATTHPIANPSMDGAEIDIFEYSPSVRDNLFHSLHWNGYDFSRGAKTVTQKNYMPAISLGYHTYGFEWTPKEYIIYIDNVEKLRTNQTISHASESIILGCGTGGFGGKLNFAGPWPDTFSIDYIKLYKRKPEVRFYETCDGYGWVSDGLQPGSYTTAQLTEKGFTNNAASAMEIPDGWAITIFNEDNFKGDFTVLKKSTACLDDTGFNDKISSIKITAKKNGR